MKALYGGDLQPRQVDLRLKITENRHEATVPGRLKYIVGAWWPADAPSGTVAHNLYDWLTEPRQGVSVSVQYRHGNEVEHYSRSNALFARLRLLDWMIPSAGCGAQPGRAASMLRQLPSEPSCSSKGKNELCASRHSLHASR